MTVECIIEQKHHRNLMGPKGSNVQGITQEHNVSIKFPERVAKNNSSSPPDDGSPPTAVNGGEDYQEKASQRDVIVITGRVENVEAAKQALLVSSH